MWKHLNIIRNFSSTDRSEQKLEAQCAFCVLFSKCGAETKQSYDTKLRLICLCEKSGLKQVLHIKQGLHQTEAPVLNTSVRIHVQLHPY